MTFPSISTRRGALCGAALLTLSIRCSLAVFPQLKLELICDRQIHSPVAMTHAGDGSGRMFIADQRGKIYIFKDGMLQPGVFLDVGAKLVSERAGFDERGLLGLAFHPGYANAESPGYRRFYVFYSAVSPNAPGTAANPVDCRTTVSEFQVSANDPNRADPASERVLVSFDKPQFNHNGGGLEFGPDGYLYFTCGDGGSSNDNNAGHTGGSAARPTNAQGNAQDLTNFMGKMHRIDPLGTDGPNGQYGIPADNPYLNGESGERPEIFAHGLRNCWRFSFDSRPGGTNRLFAADVGQGQVEEIDLITAGGNYGWRNLEGTFVPSFSINAPVMSLPPTAPVAQYAHPGITIGAPALPRYGISVTGGYVYRGTAIPTLSGKYVFADWSQSFNAPSGRILGLEETSPGSFSLTELNILGGNPIPYFVQGFGQDAAGELYVLGKTAPGVSAPDPSSGRPSGVILKIVPTPPTTAITLTASRDNTLYQEAELSDGAGEWIFAGAVTWDGNNPLPGALRRALLGFDLGPIPNGAVVASATVTLKMDKTISPAYDFSLHKISANWGEGTADADAQEGTGISAGNADATWLKPFFGQADSWISPGGDFVPKASATRSVNSETSVANGLYTWSSPQLAYDVQSWLTTPAANFGWLLKADLESVTKYATGTSGQFTISVTDTDGLAEGMSVAGDGLGPNAKIAFGGINATTNVLTLTIPHASGINGPVYFAAPSAKRFVSRNSTTASSRPKLTLNYVPSPPAGSHRKQWETANYFRGQYIDDNFDTDADGILDGLEYAWGFAPRTPDSPQSGFAIDASALVSQGKVTINFRRDPLATDLTYRLQVSTDLHLWTDLAVSSAGGTPTGPGFVSESVIDTAFRLVTAQDIPVPSSPIRYYRLKATRQ